jgi:hypothetical protein
MRALIERHLPAPYRKKATWQYVAAQLVEAARGHADAVDVAVALVLACFRPWWPVLKHTVVAR